MTQAKRLPMSVQMNDDDRILWLNRKVTAPVNRFVMDAKPPYDCPRCEGTREDYDAKRGTRWLHRSEVTCGSGWAIWKITTTCADCQGQTHWLIDPDKPVNGFKPDEKERITDFPFDAMPSEKYDFGKAISKWNEPEWESFEDFPRLLGETDFEAYCRWLKHRAQRRKDEDAS